MTEKVIVFIVSENPSSENSSKVSYLFSENLFEIKIVSINLPDLPEDAQFGRYGIKTWIDEDYYRISWLLKQSSHKYPNNHVIIVKDNIITHSTSKAIENIIQQIIYKDYDICYLSKWQDRCDLYTDFNKLDDCCSMYAKTFYPSGLQALLISPKGRELLLANVPMKNGETFWDSAITIKISQPLPQEELDITSDPTNSSCNCNIYTSPSVINHKVKIYRRYWGRYKEEERKMEDHLRAQIYSGNINAICLIPNLFSFDITNSRSNLDYGKLCECQKIPYGDIIVENNYVSWLVLVIFIIVLMIGIYLLLMR